MTNNHTMLFIMKGLNNVMRKMNTKYNIYIIPQIFYPKYKKSRVLSILFCSLTFLVMLIFFIIVMYDYGIGYIVLLLFSLVVFIYSIGDLIHGNIFKMQYIEITNEHIRVENFLTTKIIKWKNVKSIQVISNRFNPFIGVTRKDDFWLKTPSIIEFIAKIYGCFYMTIYLSKFSNLDKQRFINTINKRI